MARRLIGWCVGVAYAIAGARRRVLRRLKAGGMLPVVVHALPALELDRILGWLYSHGVLDRLWLTFDDGWATVKDCITVLEKYNVAAKVFIAPGETMRGRIWTSAAIGAGVAPDVWRGWYGLAEAERYERLEASIKSRLTGDEGKRICCDNRELLSREDVIALSRCPLVEIENHTWSHLSVPHRPVSEVLDEVRRTQTTLKEWTGRTPQWLAWPFGRGTPELDEAVGKMGLNVVYTSQGYDLPYCRNMAIEGVSFQENLGRVLGAWPKVGETL